MNKKILTAHKIIMLCVFAMLAGSLVYYLSRWNSLPEDPGVHFDSDGEFDVYASRIYGFYPHLMGSLAAGCTALVGRLISKKNTGLNISEKGEKLFKSELILTLDIIAVLITVIFLYWSLCVCRQKPLDTKFATAILGTIFGIGVTGIIAEIVTAVLHRNKGTVKKDSKIFRRICRTAAWLFTVFGYLVLLVSWERLPSGDVADEYHGLAYFGNFEAYMDKRLLLIPLIALTVILIVLEIISAKALRKNDTALDRFTARLKLLNSLFIFWWELIIIEQQKVGIISVSVYTVITVLYTVIFIRKKKAA